jgi:dTDP-4-amino-4,6-dideoxygalactose transaminase
MNPMQVPFLDLKAQYAVIKEEIRAAIDEVCDSQAFILGPKVEHLENQIAAYCGAKYGVGVSSGTDALLVALMALEIKPGDEIITTPLTFFSTAGVIARLNAKPVFVDIDPVTFNLDPSRLRDSITAKTKAIIPVHLFGQCSDMDPILELAEDNGLFVIEDAAQSIGAEYKGRRAGSIGHLGCLSFFPSKNLGGFGDGGMVVTNDPRLHEKVKILRIHGSKTKYFHSVIGGNFRLDAIQAAILSVKLNYLEGWSESRRINAQYYDQAFLASGLIDKGLITTPAPAYKDKGDANYHIYNQYTLRAKSRNRLQVFLKEYRIGTEVYYPLPLHLQKCFADLGYAKGSLPVSDKASEQVLSIPIYPELTKSMKEYVVGKIRDFYRLGHIETQ